MKKYTMINIKFMIACLVFLSLLFSQEKGADEESGKQVQKMEYIKNNQVQLSGVLPFECLAYDKSTGECVLSVYEYNLFIRAFKPVQLIVESDVKDLRKSILNECLQLKYYYKAVNVSLLEEDRWTQIDFEEFIKLYKEEIQYELDMQKAEQTFRDFHTAFLAKDEYYESSNDKGNIEVVVNKWIKENIEISEKF